MQDKLRLEGLTLSVENVAKSVEFYGGLLGFEVAYQTPAFALIKVGGELGGTIGLLSAEQGRKAGANDMTPHRSAPSTSSSPPMTSTACTRSCKPGV